MSLNIGQDGHRAASALRTNEDWTRLRAAIGAMADKAVDAAIECDPAIRVERTGYARALRDIWVELEAATTGAHQRVIPKRTTVGKSLTEDDDGLTTTLSGQTQPPVGQTKTLRGHTRTLAGQTDVLESLTRG